MVICDLCKRGQPLRSGRNRPAFRVQQTEAQRLQHTGPAVVGGRTTDADDEAAAAPADRIKDHLAHPAGRRTHRIQPVPSEQRDTGGFRHLHHRRPAVPQHAVPGLSLLSERACHRGCPHRAAHPERQRFRGSLPAVCQRTHLDLRVRKRPKNPVADGSARVKRAERALEGIDGNHNLHI